MVNLVRNFGGALCVLLCSGVLAGSARAESFYEKPAEVQNVGIDEHLQAQLPLETAFLNHDGTRVRLADYFRNGKPVILSLNYSNCPMLCSLQLNGLIKSLGRLSLTAGVDYQLLSVSIDPKETAFKAFETREKYQQLYGRGPNSFQFLVGRERSIKAVADAVGFRYQYLPEKNEYAHAAAAVLCTPEGKISRYLYGIEFPDQTLRLSLVEASEGKIGSAGDQFLLFCFHYVPDSGKYLPNLARFVMAVAGCVTTLMLIGGFFILRSRENSSLPVPAGDAPSQDPGQPQNQ